MNVGEISLEAMNAMAALGVAEVLKSGPCSADEIAAALGVHAPSLYRLLRACAELGLVQEQAGQVFALTKTGELLGTDYRSMERDILKWLDEPSVRQVWAGLADSVRTGRPAWELQQRQPFWDYLAENERVGRMFDNAMTALARQQVVPALRAYDFSQFDIVVDVGGGHGTALAAVLAAHPGVRGVLYDQPAVVAGAGQVLRAAGVEQRCTVESGSFFDRVPVDADAYLLSHIIHDWEDEQAVRILANCRDAMAPHGRVLLVEGLIPDLDEPSSESRLVKLLDLVMLVLCGGKERTKAEFAQLFHAAGLTFARFIPTETESVIEAVRSD